MRNRICHLARVEVNDQPANPAGRMRKAQRRRGGLGAKSGFRVCSTELNRHVALLLTTCAEYEIGCEASNAMEGVGAAWNRTRLCCAC